MSFDDEIANRTFTIVAIITIVSFCLGFIAGLGASVIIESIKF